MKPLGIAIIVSTVLSVRLVAASETVHLYTLIHWPSVALVLGVTLGILLVWQPTARWRRFLAFLKNRSEFANRPQNAYRQRALGGFLTAASRSALIAGLVGELLGVFMILTAARNPAAIEPGISIATVSLLYGLLLSELVFQRFRKRIVIDSATVASSTEQVAPKLRPHRVGGTSRAATS